MRTLVMMLFVVLAGCAEDPKGPPPPGPGLEITAAELGFRVRLPDDTWSAGWSRMDPSVKGCENVVIPLIARNAAMETDVSFFSEKAGSPESMARELMNKAPLEMGWLRLYANPNLERAELQFSRYDAKTSYFTKIVFVSGKTAPPERIVMVVGTAPIAHERDMYRSVERLVSAIEPYPPRP